MPRPGPPLTSASAPGSSSSSITTQLSREALPGLPAHTLSHKRSTVVSRAFPFKPITTLGSTVSPFFT